MKWYRCGATVRRGFMVCPLHVVYMFDVTTNVLYWSVGGLEWGEGAQRATHIWPETVASGARVHNGVCESGLARSYGMHLPITRKFVFL